MLNECRVDPKYLQQMFPDLDRFADLHKSLLEQLIERYNVSKNKFVDSIGDILINIVCVYHFNFFFLIDNLNNFIIILKSLRKNPTT